MLKRKRTPPRKKRTWTDDQKIDWLAQASMWDLFPEEFHDETQLSIIGLLARRIKALEDDRR